MMEARNPLALEIFNTTLSSPVT